MPACLGRVLIPFMSENPVPIRPATIWRSRGSIARFNAEAVLSFWSSVNRAKTRICIRAAPGVLVVGMQSSESVTILLGIHARSLIYVRLPVSHIQVS